MNWQWLYYYYDSQDNPQEWSVIITIITTSRPLHSSSRKIIFCRFINRFLSSFVSSKFIVNNGQRNKILMLTDFPLMSFCDLWLEIAQKSRSIVVMCLNNNNNLWLTLSDIYFCPVKWNAEWSLWVNICILCAKWAFANVYPRSL